MVDELHDDISIARTVSSLMCQCFPPKRLKDKKITPRRRPARLIQSIPVPARLLGLCLQLEVDSVSSLR